MRLFSWRVCGPGLWAVGGPELIQYRRCLRDDPVDQVSHGGQLVDLTHHLPGGEHADIGAAVDQTRLGHDRRVGRHREHGRKRRLR